ncbi:response regulator [Cesiribacter sp. SM1]|uniref:response regulator n=1 Tax=Cesiribacter sp. SM1 TaxID=2861196 RepID=UPI001CD2A933|nr:response regulator [Cesiribacter sp. SM1]
MATFGSITKSTKVKVFLAFGLLTIGLVVALYFAITSFRQISQSVETLAKPNSMPVHLSQLLTSLSDSESHLRAYSLTQDNTYLKAYEENTADVYKQLNSLKKANQDERWQRRLDTLTTLINKKVEGLNSFTVLKTQLDRPVFTDKALKRLQDQANDPVSVNTTLKKIEREVKRDLPPPPKVRMEKVEKKGILNKIFARDKKAPVVTMGDSSLVTTTKEVSVDTIVLAQPMADSLINGMRKMLREIQREETSNRRQLSKQELELLAFDQVVMEQIRRIIHLMEQEETAISNNRIRKAQHMVDEASLIIFLISCTGLVTSFVFVALVIRDISRSNFLKAQLEKARRKEEQLRQVKEQFLANMSHEIRTPLNAIVGFSEQLRQQALPAQQRKQVEAIRFSSDFLLSTVNDILDMSKIEAGQISFEKIDFDLLQILQQTTQLINGRATEKGLVFKPDLPLAPAYIKGDPFRLQQILYNLLGNAVKFTDSGAVKLKCRVRDNGFGKYLVDITVSDSGIGIAAEKLKQIFESFTQADPSITRRYGGSGLGLAITKRLIDLQGGEISVRSREGRGTVFYITIPYPKGRPVEEQAPLISKPESIPATWQNMQVLVVDDDPLNVLLLNTILQKWHIPTEIANSGQEALNKLGARRYDLVLTDMNMPGMSGLQLLEKVRQLTGNNSQIPVVAVTANAMKTDLARYLELGMTAYLLKPFQESELLQLLATIWKDAAPAPPAEAGKKVSTKVQAPAPASVQQSGYSIEIYQKYSGGDPDALKLMLCTFLENTNEYLPLMEQYCQQQNWGQLKELAHKMFPSVKQFKAEKAAKLLRRMELEEAPAEVRTAWVAEFRTEALQIMSFVQAELQETAASAASQGSW